MTLPRAQTQENIRYHIVNKETQTALRKCILLLALSLFSLSLHLVIILSHSLPVSVCPREQEVKDDKENKSFFTIAVWKQSGETIKYTGCLSKLLFANSV